MYIEKKHREKPDNPFWYKEMAASRLLTKKISRTRHSFRHFKKRPLLEDALLLFYILPLLQGLFCILRLIFP